jgi:hypothetical protein
LGFGLLPAVRAARTDLRGAMSVTSRGATLDRSARRLLGSFVVIELAIAAALLTASVTATQYFRKLIEEPWGFETKDRLAFNVTVPDRFFPTAAAKQNALEASLAQLQQVPGVKAATVVSPSPMDAPRRHSRQSGKAVQYRSGRDLKGKRSVCHQGTTWVIGPRLSQL